MHKMMKHESIGVPCTVRMRAYIPHALIVLIALTAYVLIFQFVMGNATRDVAELRRVKDSPVNEIVYAAEKNVGETFYYLKNYAVAGGNNQNAVSDVLMLMPVTTYGANSVYFDGTLPVGSCAVSANIAARYQLNVGDFARILGTEKRFCVERVITAQAGLDEEYMHDGIVILSYDAELLDKGFLYLTFGNDGDAYRSLDRLIFVEDLAEGRVLSLALYALAALGVIAAVMIVCECLLFRARRYDYATLMLLGERKNSLFAKIWGENLLKYVIPAFLVAAIYGISYTCYAMAYWLPAAAFVAVCVVATVVYSLILTRRLYNVRAK